MISNLPDDLLIRILSFLPTKEALRTSILSSRWEKLWTLVPTLYFEPDKFIGKDENRKYIDFIERVFLSHNSKINKFHIKCTGQIEMSHHLKTWLSIVDEHGVQDIKIAVLDRHMELPQSTLTCKTLVSLKLIGLHYNYIQFDHVPAFIHFPYLKVLHVDLLSPSSALTQNLFCSSPVLEDLSIHARHEDCEEYMYNISSPFLKKLFVNIYKMDDSNYTVNVDAPILESLEVHYYSYLHFILKNSSTLIKARLVKWEKVGENFIKLLKSVSLVKELSLGGLMAGGVTSAEMECPVFPFVTYLTWDVHANINSGRWRRQDIFSDLIHLQLDLYSICYYEYFLKILSWVPNLSTLLINKMYSFCEIKYLEQAEVPRCLRSHVKEIELLQFKGSHGELKLIKFLLESARELEKLTVNIRGDAGKKGVWLKEEIFMLPISSKIVNLYII